MEIHAFFNAFISFFCRSLVQEYYYNILQKFTLRLFSSLPRIPTENLSGIPLKYLRDLLRNCTSIFVCNFSKGFGRHFYRNRFWNISIYICIETIFFVSFLNFGALTRARKKPCDNGTSCKDVRKPSYGNKYFRNYFGKFLMDYSTNSLKNPPLAFCKNLS